MTALLINLLAACIAFGACLMVPVLFCAYILQEEAGRGFKERESPKGRG